MGIIKRGTLYLWRKKNKTIILFLILFVLTIVLIMSTMLLNSTNDALTNLRNSLGGYFKIDANTEQGFYNYVDDELVNEVLDSDISDFTGNDTIYSLVDFGLVEGRFSAENDEKSKLARIIGTTSSKYDEYFVLKSLQLETGRHIKAKDQNVALISENVAKKNGLSIGDYINMEYYSDPPISDDKINVECQLEVIGIFSVKRTQNKQSASTAECDIVDNFIFTDTYSIRTLLNGVTGKAIDSYSDGVIFYVKDPKILDAKIKDINSKLNFEEDRYVITKNNKIYEASAAVLNRINGLVFSIIVVVIIVASIILSLVLMLWIRDRVYEMGILISIGIRKCDIFIQQFTENMLITLSAFFMAGMILGISISPIKGIVRDAVTVYDDKGIVLDDNSIAEIGSDEIEIANNMKLGIMGYFVVLALEVVIIFISTGVSSLLILKMNPKNILTMMS